jgi:hypothetical protein
MFIRKQRDETIPAVRPEDWSAYVLSGSGAETSSEFIEDMEDLPVQEREL